MCGFKSRLAHQKKVIRAMADEDTKNAVTEDDVAASAPEIAEGEEKPFEFVEAPSFDIEEKPDCAYEVKASIPACNTQKQAEEIFTELSHEAEVPGFRKGRVPRKLLEAKFGKVVKGEVDSKLVSAAYEKLVKDKDLHPLAMPEIDGLKELEDRKEGDPLVVTFKFEVMPKVELGTYRGISIERPVYAVQDKDVDETIERLRSRYSVFETIDGGVAAEGDQVVISFEGTIDGEPFAGGLANDYPYILGSKRFFPEFETVLTGSKAGSELTCDVSFPDDAPRPDLRGKAAQFKIHVKEVKRRNVPALDEAFAKQAGYESVADLREKVAADLRSHMDEDSKRIVESRALDTVVEASSFEIPKSLIENMTEDHFQEGVRRLQELRVPAAEIETQREAIQAKAREDALASIKRTVCLNEIAEAEGIEAEDIDFEQEAETISQSTGIEIDAVTNYIAQEDRRSSYMGRIVRRKALAVIVDNAKIVDKEVSHEEMHEEGHEH